MCGREGGGMEPPRSLTHLLADIQSRWYCSVPWTLPSPVFRTQDAVPVSGLQSIEGGGEEEVEALKNGTENAIELDWRG